MYDDFALDFLYEHLYYLRLDNSFVCFFAIYVPFISFSSLYADLDLQHSVTNSNDNGHLILILKVMLTVSHHWQEKKFFLSSMLLVINYECVGFY